MAFPIPGTPQLIAPSNVGPYYAKEAPRAVTKEELKVIIRQLLVAKAKETIGNIRGTFSGKVHIPQAELQMDYQMLITQGQQEYQKVMDNLEKRLERLNPAAVLENQAKIIQQNLEIQKATPLGIFVI